MNESYWQKTSQHPCFKQLNKDIKTDILIIGGGLSGISCAYQLKETGKQITIVEKNLLGSHTSGHTKLKCYAKQKCFVLYVKKNMKLI